MVYPDEWFNLTFEVNCNITVVHLYTSGYVDKITEDPYIRHYIRLSGPTPVCSNEFKKNFSIHIYMTSEVDEHLNGIITARGVNTNNTIESCTSLPSARYYLQHSIISSTVPGQSNIIKAFTATNISANLKA